jgi:hypothetical protein
LIFLTFKYFPLQLSMTGMLSHRIVCLMFNSGTNGSGFHVSINQSTSLSDNFSFFEVFFGSTVLRINNNHSINATKQVSINTC